MRVGRKLSGAFGAVAAAVVMTTALAGTALAGSAMGDTGFGEIAVSNSNKCLDVRAQDGFYSPGARVQQWDCSGVPEQQWQLHPYATVPSPYNPAVSVTIFQIQSERSGLCMEVAGGGSHALVRQNTCGTGPASDLAHQLFISVPLGNTSLRYLRPWSSPSLCLDVQNGSDDNGNLLQQYPCTGGGNQKFYGLPLVIS
jgi:Ricin-type beta-trefoil lectin domain-like